MRDACASKSRISKSGFALGLKTGLCNLGLSLTLLIASAVQSQAETDTYRYQAPDGTITFSDFPISRDNTQRSSYIGFTKTPSVVNPCRELSPQQLAEKGRRLDSQFLGAAWAFGVDAALIKAVARAESCFDPTAVSSAGAEGLMQLMPATALELGVKDSFNTAQNLRAGADYLARMLKRYSNNLDLSLAAYNAGPGNVDKYGGVPPFKETIHYIERVKSFQARYASETPFRTSALDQGR
ncbi:MAG: lytic transglycosylase domain-containing protein [Granulosicoccus sp.]|nr:lytic transglycosylase domain-containing protein [Granulosicoccus sp.]